MTQQSKGDLKEDMNKDWDKTNVFIMECEYFTDRLTLCSLITWLYTVPKCLA